MVGGLTAAVVVCFFEIVNQVIVKKFVILEAIKVADDIGIVGFGCVGCVRSGVGSSED